MQTQDTPGQLLAAMRARNPLVQNITNFVAMNIAANVMLAAGASPAMIHAEEEADFAGLAAALTVNVGTLAPAFLAGMKAAAKVANAAGKPWVLDPVAHFVTPYRRAAVAELVALKPTIIRGNASEIIALDGKQSSGKGADARDSVTAAETSAITLARELGCIVGVTGEVDFVTDGMRSARISGGSELMPRVTALGCSLTCLVGAFVATVPEKPFEATITAMALFAVAGERAAKRAEGPGSFSPLFLDELSAITPDMLDAQAQVISL